jgi:hypothetical protein
MAGVEFSGWLARPAIIEPQRPVSWAPAGMGKRDDQDARTVEAIDDTEG